ncbi:hypothetical protein BKA62DRAFT_795375, partial [Auriculariales sp. MPI-PUGE-AT-0066]
AQACAGVRKIAEGLKKHQHCSKRAEPAASGPSPTNPPSELKRSIDGSHEAGKAISLCVSDSLPQEVMMSQFFLLFDQKNVHSCLVSPRAHPRGQCAPAFSKNEITDSLPKLCSAEKKGDGLGDVLAKYEEFLTGTITTTRSSSCDPGLYRDSLSASGATKSSRKHIIQYVRVKRVHRGFSWVYLWTPAATPTPHAQNTFQLASVLVEDKLARSCGDAVASSATDLQHAHRGPSTLQARSNAFTGPAIDLNHADHADSDPKM